MLDNPVSVLTAANQNIDITNTITIAVQSSPQPDPPVVGGGTANIAFLEGTGPQTQAGGNVLAPNANAFVPFVRATFWIETVNYSLTVSPEMFATLPTGKAPLLMRPACANPQAVLPTFAVHSPDEPLTVPKTFDVQSTQIQYMQYVLLNFSGNSWPHVSVATLVSANPVHVKIPV
jgi:hypothetical protein